MSETIVVNILVDDFDVYIGRKGRGYSGYFGNPFRLDYGEPRGSTLNLFKAYFLDRMKKDSKYRASILGLTGKRLGCFCKPGPCHGDIIANYLNTKKKKKTASD